MKLMNQAKVDWPGDLKPETFQPVSKIQPIDAVGYWLSRGLTSCQLIPTVTRPRGLSKTSLWTNRKRNSFHVHRNAVNCVLKQAGYPSWNIIVLEAELFTSGQLIGKEKLGRSIAWELSQSILSESAAVTLTGGDERPVGAGEEQPTPVD